ncbi:MAG: HPr family phosphocarrier protein [Lachnospiraceae bacterium]|nr:HPr family phosphocarrier protein [Lachnospiraceae bacterium]
MQELVYILTDPVGLHARPAGDFVKAVQQLACKVTVEKDGRTADAKRLLAVMGLGAKGGDAITMHFEGEGEEEACRMMQEYLSQHL